MTITFRDLEIQTYLNKLNSNRKGLAKIEIWFWEALEEEINKHYELAHFYDDKILKKI
jgi:hypothetical protein